MALKDFFISKDSSISVTSEDSYIEQESEPINLVWDEWTSDISEVYQKVMEEEKPVSIYKVKDLVNSLPKELPKNDIKKSLVGICAVAGIDMSSLIDDGNIRKVCLRRYFDGFTLQSNSKISELQSQISQAEESIENAKKEILALKNLGSELSKNITTEEAFIDDLTSYLN